MNKKLENQIINIFQGKQIKDNPTCYIYDLNIIKNNVDAVMNYAPQNIGLYYAMKANPNKYILKYLKSLDEVKGIEIASSGELSKAMKYYDPKNILFTGPAKTLIEIEEALKYNIRLINVESIIEAIRINKIASELKIEKVDILLRINLNHKIEEAAENMGGISTKMGIEEDNYLDEYKIISKLEHLNIKGIHVFSASGILDYKGSIKYANYVFEMVNKLELQGQHVEIIDLGGGLGIDYSGNDVEFDTKTYFEELRNLINKYSFNDKEIILELGCYLVGTAGYYAAKIIDIKNSKGYKHVVIAGGLNHIPTATLNGKHPFHIIKMNEEKEYDSQLFVHEEKVDIDGPLCTAEDKVLWDVYIDHAEIGDIVLIRQAGAYCYSCAWLEFLSRKHPKEIIL